MTDAGVGGDAICGDTGDTHGASLGCVDNYPAWLALIE